MRQATLEVIVPGPLTTVQDRGRTGFRHVGVARAGALDPDAAALANRLVGNADDAAVLEMTLAGVTLAFDVPLRVALCGALADMAHIARDGTCTSLGHGRPLRLPPGRLRVGRLRLGVRAWLAIAGTVSLPQVMGSRSTDLRGGFGGLGGRALARGDRVSMRVPALDVDTPSGPSWWVEFDDPIDHGVDLHYVPSAHPAAAGLAAGAWTVDPRSNRQGLRLQGPALESPRMDIVSGPVAPGTLQLPPDGHPIVLLADAQTTGGYPRLGHVCAADLPRLAQVAPGQRIRWTPVDLEGSRVLRRQRQARWKRLAHLLDTRLDPWMG
ncbi:biotin-dependent carboxyltransferase family protein [Lysobacter sp. SG-8]|uniref:Biotin-dependent carboxyltransferase family protein n=1 Tax=Marilutibacter penaei TaxID=2759900 RepID=A0A7W3U2J4_9GAMM|nr:biotin-dependent carboxyltransferase family protein [Lysobacter penaei]MBB1087455.1 biotin-dependent carboxyltransferase family protein [Lysobacter penaei]